MLNEDMAMAGNLLPITIEPVMLMPEDMVSSPTLVTQVCMTRFMTRADETGGRASMLLLYSGGQERQRLHAAAEWGCIAGTIAAVAARQLPWRFDIQNHLDLVCGLPRLGQARRNRQHASP